MPIGNKKGNFVYPGYGPLEVPNSPTGLSVTEGDAELTVSFTAPTNTGGGGIISYTAAAVEGGTPATGTSPLTITGLSNGTSYNVRVWALNSYGPGPYGVSSGTPVATVGLFLGGENDSGTARSDVIQYVSIASTGNSVDWGDLSATRQSMGTCASSVRGLSGGGREASDVNTIEYITFSSVGNAVDFGDLTTARKPANGCINNDTRGVFVGGGGSGTMDYVTMASTGNATSFGTMPFGTQSLAGSSSNTRGVFNLGQQSGSRVNSIYYITIASTGNGTDFGDLLSVLENSSACSSDTRAVFGGGYNGTSSINVLQYITIASTGNATDFGDLNNSVAARGSCSSKTRGLYAGGLSYSDFSRINVIDYITIASTGNATDFGDLLGRNQLLGAFCNRNGGLS
jgi:hypothetical protein